MEGVIAVSIPIVAVIIVGLMTKWISDNRLRRQLMNVSPEVAQVLLTSVPDTTDNSLKWGIVSVGVGAALVTIQLSGIEPTGPLAIGLVFIFGGAGLLAHYVIATTRGDRSGM